MFFQLLSFLSPFSLCLAFYFYFCLLFLILLLLCKRNATFEKVIRKSQQFEGF